MSMPNGTFIANLSQKSGEYLGWEDLSELDGILATELLEVFKNTYDFWLEELEGKNIDHRSVFPDDFLKNLCKYCRKNLYRPKKFRTFFRHAYQIKGFCKYYWNKAYISQSDYIELFYKH